MTGMGHVTIEDRTVVPTAIDAAESGMDFADALHIVRSSKTSGFVTFDKRLVRRAKAIQLHTTIELLGPPPSPFSSTQTRFLRPLEVSLRHKANRKEDIL